MDCKGFKELAPAMALGALDESERAACAAHLAAAGPHDGCRAAEAEALAVAARLSDILPDRAVNPRVWRAIADRIGAPVDAPSTEPGAMPGAMPLRRSRRRWRELAGWIVAAVVVGAHLYNAPVNNAREVGARGADIPPPSPATSPALKSALNLMMGAHTRRYVFQSKPSGTARAALIVDPALRTAVVIADHVAPGPGQGLRLWAVRAQGASPTVALLASIGVDGGGLAAAEIGTALFGQDRRGAPVPDRRGAPVQDRRGAPVLPAALWLSADPPDAGAPRSVLMVANLGDRPGD